MDDWNLPCQAPIVSLPDAVKYLEDLRGGNPEPTIALTSGGYDPIHAGHITSIQDGRRLAEEFHLKAHGQSPWLQMIVLVNGTQFLKTKKGEEFMSLKARCQVVSAIRGVDLVVPLWLGTDMTVCEPLKALKPNYFLKGGDRKLSNIPEVDVCSTQDTKIITGCGMDKFWSSSNFLNEYFEKRRKREMWRKIKEHCEKYY